MNAEIKNQVNKIRKQKRGGFKSTLRKIESWRKVYTQKYLLDELSNEEYFKKINILNEKKIELIKKHEKVIEKSKLNFTVDELTDRLCLLQSELLKKIQTEPKEEIKPYLINQSAHTIYNNIYVPYYTEK